MDLGFSVRVFAYGTPFVRRKRRRVGPSVDPCLGYWDDKEITNITQAVPKDARGPDETEQQQVGLSASSPEPSPPKYSRAPMVLSSDDDDGRIVTVEAFLQKAVINSNMVTYSRSKQKRRDVVNLLRTTLTSRGESGDPQSNSYLDIGRSITKPQLNKQNKDLLLSDLSSRIPPPNISPSSSPSKAPTTNSLLLQPLYADEPGIITRPRLRPKLPVAECQPRKHIKCLSVFPQPAFPIRPKISDNTATSVPCIPHTQHPEATRNALSAWMADSIQTSDSRLKKRPRNISATRKSPSTQEPPNDPSFHGSIQQSLHLIPLSQNSMPICRQSIKPIAQLSDIGVVGPSTGLPIFVPQSKRKTTGEINQTNMGVMEESNTKKIELTQRDRLSKHYSACHVLEPGKIDAENCSHLPLASMDCSAEPAKQDTGGLPSKFRISTAHSRLGCSEEQDYHVSREREVVKGTQSYQAPVSLHHISPRSHPTPNESHTRDRPLQSLTRLCSGLLENAPAIALTKAQIGGKRKEPKFKDSHLEHYFTLPKSQMESVVEPKGNMILFVDDPMNESSFHVSSAKSLEAGVQPSECCLPSDSLQAAACDNMHEIEASQHQWVKSDTISGSSYIAASSPQSNNGKLTKNNFIMSLPPSVSLGGSKSILQYLQREDAGIFLSSPSPAPGSRIVSIVDMPTT